MSDIFIAYSRSDAAIAERLVQHFRQEGWEVFIDSKPMWGGVGIRKSNANCMQQKR